MYSPLHPLDPPNPEGARHGARRGAFPTVAKYLAILCGLLPALADAASCASRLDWAPVVELYTSEGCSSCPPADRWLTTLGTQGVVPLSFHVDYWNYIGWKDPYSSAEYSERQRKLARAEGGTVVYTPQVRLAGEDFRGWHQTGRVSDRLSRLQTPPGKPVDIALSTDAGQISVQMSTLLPADSVAYVALYERGLVSSVERGENAGRRLEHDFVVRRFVGPFAARADGQLDIRQRFSQEDGWNGDRLGVALVQADARTHAARFGAAMAVCSR